MRVLIGYDGSSYADVALEDLKRAGLPERVEALVVTVGEPPVVYPLARPDIVEPAAASLSEEKNFAWNAASKLLLIALFAWAAAPHEQIVKV